jgi:hypothetical protein
MSDGTLCSVCGKPIEPGEGRFADIQRATRAMRQVHIACMTDAPSQPVSLSPLRRLSLAIRRAVLAR